MTWPNTVISTDNLDAGSDQPKNARADLLATVQAVNQMIAQGPTLGIAEVYWTGGTRTAQTLSASDYNAANISLGDSFGNVVTTNQGNIQLKSGTYKIEFPPHGQTRSPTTYFNSNVASYILEYNTTPGKFYATAGDTRNRLIMTFSDENIEILFPKLAGFNQGPGFQSIIFTKLA